MGHEAQRRMMASSAVVVGLSGLGAEIAKNVILAGLHELLLVDPWMANEYDWGGNFYLPTTTTTGVSRAEACRAALAELNPYVTVQTATTTEVPNLSSESLVPLIARVRPTVLVLTVPLPETVVIAVNEACRSVGTCFLYAVTYSVFAMAFADFGTQFVVTDKDGEAAATSQIEHVLCDEYPPVVKVLEDAGRHGLETGDKVTFGRLQGVPGLEPDREYEVKVTGPYTFELLGVDLRPTVTASSSSSSEHAVQNQQGYITQCKQPVTLQFEPFAQKLEQPGEFMLSDFAKMDRSPVLHLGFRALTQYLTTHGELPAPGNVPAMTEVYTLAQQLDRTGILADNNSNAANRRILAHLASGSRAVLSPMCAALGGLVGQEVLKACSGKFTPINGFFYLDADECLPDTVLPAEQLTTTGRYASQVAVFGQDMQLPVKFVADWAQIRHQRQHRIINPTSKRMLQD